MPAKKHDFTGTELKAGALVIVSAAVLILFIAVIIGIRPPKKTHTFHAYFKDTGGLDKGADVRFGGAKVGRIRAITFDSADQSKIWVEAQVAKEIPVNAKSEAYITQTSLTAEKHLEISTGDKEAVPLKDGDQITSRQGSLLDQADELAKKVQAFLDDAKKLMGVQEAKEKAKAANEEMATVASIFDTVDKTIEGGSDLVDDIRGVVGDTKDDISKILAKVQDIEDSAKTLISDLNGVLGENRASIKGAIEGVQGIVERVKGVSDRLDEMAAALQATLDNAKSLSGDTQGIIDNNRPVIEDIVLDLRETVRYLKDFSRTMAEQPEAVIRGKSLEGRK